MVILCEIPFPDQFSGGGLKAIKVMSLRTGGINFPVLDDRCSVRARFLARNKSPRRVIRFLPRKSPKQFPRSFLKAKNAATDLRAVEKRVGNINPSFGDDRTGKSIPDRSSPPNRQTFCREWFSDAPFVPDPIATAAPPLRPVFGPRGQCERDGKKNYDDPFGHLFTLSENGSQQSSFVKARRMTPTMVFI